VIFHELTMESLNETHEDPHKTSELWRSSWPMKFFLKHDSENMHKLISVSFLICIYHVQDIQVQKLWYTNVVYDKMGSLLMIMSIF
jgi:hypothetical protein